jgi:hypothetical protein
MEQVLRLILEPSALLVLLQQLIHLSQAKEQLLLGHVVGRMEELVLHVLPSELRMEPVEAM